MGNGILAGTALVAFGVLYWQSLWPKVQCVLMVLIGWGLGGLLGSWLQTLISGADSLSNQAMQLLFGVGVPSLVALLALLIFTLDMLPNRVVHTKPIGWHTRIAGLLVPLSLSALPALGANLSASIGM